MVAFFTFCLSLNAFTAFSSSVISLTICSSVGEVLSKFSAFAIAASKAFFAPDGYSPGLSPSTAL